MANSIFLRGILIIAIYLSLISCAVAICYWADIDDSHYPTGNWCDRGYAITALDLDGGDPEGLYPVIGAVRCCDLPNIISMANWQCSWRKIGFQWSHYASEGRYPMCPTGSYMTAIDLDALEDNDGNSPIIGRVRCCSPGGSPSWMQTYWSFIGYDLSHKKSNKWCDSGDYIVSIDLDAVDDNDGNSPIVGQCQCATPG